MKRRHLLLLLLACNLCTTNAENRTVINPDYRFKNTGIDNISKIEMNDTVTKVHIHITFLYDAWVEFDSTDYIQPVGTVKKFYLKAMENGEMNTHLFTRTASGETDYVLLFPPLDKSVKEIHFLGDGGDKRRGIYNVSLEKSFDTLRYEAQRRIPDEITRRMNEEVAKTAHKKTADFDSDTFFDDSPARLVGYIRGYDGDTLHRGLLTNQLSTGQVQQFPLTVYPNGYFESNIEIAYPQILSFGILQAGVVDFYIEPGHTLAMILDWEDILAADRFRWWRYMMTKTRFMGSLADVNEDLLQRKISKPTVWHRNWQLASEQPDTYKQGIEDRIKSNLDTLQLTLAQRPLSAKAIRLIENEIKLDAVSEMLEFANRYQFRENPVDSIPTGFYEIMKTIPFDDRSLLSVISANNFITQLNMSPVYYQPGNFYQPDFHPSISLAEYFVEEGIQLSEEETEILSFLQKYAFTLPTPSPGPEEMKKIAEEVKEKEKQFQSFFEKYGENALAYSRQYMKIDQLASYMFNVKKRDELLRNTFHVGDGIVKDALMLRFLMSYDNPDVSAEERKVILQNFKAYLSTVVAQKLDIIVYD
jgi:hypothetical protein